MKWYENKAIIILLLIFFFPVGLFLMWKYTDWQKNVKIIVSAVVAVAVILIGIFYQPESTPTETGTNSTPATSTTSSISESKTSSTATSSNAPTSTSTSEVETTTSTNNTSSAASSTVETSNSTATELKVVSVTSPVARNETARLEIKGAANTEYTISVYYGSGASKAEGLEKKTSNASGVVVWKWKVGGSTTEGSHRIVVAGGGAKVETSFTTT